MKRAKRYLHPLDRIGGEAAELGPVSTAAPEPKSKLALVRTRRELSDAYLESVLDFPRDRTFLLIDADTDGLQCRLGAHRATWLFYHDDRRHARRKMTSKRLGFFPAMTTEQARDAARIERGRIAAGDLSPGKREAIKVETSITEYVAYLESKIAKRKRKPSPSVTRRSRQGGSQRPQLRQELHPAEVGPMDPERCCPHPGAVEDWHKDVTGRPAKSPRTIAAACFVRRIDGAPSAM